jgi:hypothetical protein
MGRGQEQGDPLEVIITEEAGVWGGKMLLLGAQAARATMPPFESAGAAGMRLGLALLNLTSLLERGKGRAGHRQMRVSSRARIPGDRAMHGNENGAPTAMQRSHNSSGQQWK